MKIGLIGNMNNNNFALMRYFRDLGADAHLLLFANDGTGTLSHFKPEADTWFIDRWAPYIHQTDIINGPVAGLSFPLSWLMGYRYLLLHKLGRQDSWTPPVSKRQIRRAYEGYDRLVGSGIAPAMLYRVGRALDIFYPYGTGVEFFGDTRSQNTLATSQGFKQRFAKAVIERQGLGLKKARHVLNAEAGLTRTMLRNFGIEDQPLAIPMVYIERDQPNEIKDPALLELRQKIAGSDFSLLHHSRLLWKNPGGFSSQEWTELSKNSDRFIRSYAEFVKLKPQLKPLALILEYGPDVEATKQLVDQLNLQPFVCWLPTMSRKEILWIIGQVSLVVGEFYDVPRTIWGGTGWEAFASGKALLQGFQFEVKEYEALFGHPAPPLYPVNSSRSILQNLLIASEDPDELNRIGFSAKVWFNTYNGMALAKKWLAILEA
jgi:hypothetical protein